MNLFDLSGKVALITGATSGVGAQQARALTSAGASVVLTGRREHRLQSLCDELNAVSKNDKPDIAHYVVFDLLGNDPLEKLVEQSLAFYQRVDILCNTAGVNLRQHADEVSFEGWDATLHLNLKIPFFLAQKLVAGMKERGWGKIINIASLQSMRAFQNGIVYGASKGGVSQLTRAMAEAWACSGIGCNAIAPGFFPTELTQAVFDNQQLSKQFADQTAVGRNGELTDLDGVCIFLASHASDYVSGQVIYVDGGFTAK